MGMRIRTNVSSLTAQRQTSLNNKAQAKSLERLSSGYRINKSADDAAGLAVSEGLRAKVRGLNVARRNANDGVSMVQIAEGAMNEMSNMLIRLRELTVQSASDTIGTKERGYLNREYNQLVDEMDRVINVTEFNGRKLFQSEEETYVIQVGTNYSAPEENEHTITIDLQGLNFNTQSEGIELGKGAIIGPTEEEDAPSRDAIAGRISNITNALGRLASERATLGSVQSRLDSTINNLGTGIEGMQAAKSRIRDVDFAAESSRLSQSRVMLASSTSVLSQANAVPEMALQLLR